MERPVKWNLCPQVLLGMSLSSGSWLNYLASHPYKHWSPSPTSACVMQSFERSIFTSLELLCIYKYLHSSVVPSARDAVSPWLLEDFACFHLFNFSFRASCLKKATCHSSAQFILGIQGFDCFAYFLLPYEDNLHEIEDVLLFVESINELKRAQSWDDVSRWNKEGCIYLFYVGKFPEICKWPSRRGF